MQTHMLQSMQGGNPRQLQLFTAARRGELLPIHRGIISDNPQLVARSKAHSLPPNSRPAPALSLPLSLSLSPPQLAAWSQLGSVPLPAGQLLLPATPSAPMFPPMSAIGLPQLTAPPLPLPTLFQSAVPSLPLLLAASAAEAPASALGLASPLDLGLAPMAKLPAAVSVATESMLAGVSPLCLSPPLTHMFMPGGFFACPAEPLLQVNTLGSLHGSPLQPAGQFAELYSQASPLASSPPAPSVLERPPVPAPSAREPRTINYLNRDEFIQLQELVSAHGEDWECVGELMGIRPRDLAKNWVGYSVDTQITKAWTHEEMVLLYLCRTLGIDCRRTAKIIHTKLPLQCRRKTLKRPVLSYEDASQQPPHARGLRRLHRRASGSNPSRSSVPTPATDMGIDSAGSDGEDETSGGGDCTGGDVDGMGGSDIEWGTGHDDDNFFRSIPMPTANSTCVTQAVEEYYRAHGHVDWAAVSAQTGHAVVECLEQSRFNEGKPRWTYNCESFSWEQAQALHSFIVQFYPAPTPIDFAAVSNLLWVHLPDCMLMYRMLRGEFEWTPESQRLASQLATEGLPNAEIARRLSPTMGGHRVMEALRRSGAREPLAMVPPRVDAASLARIREVVATRFRPDAPDVHHVLDSACRALPTLRWRRVYESTLIVLSQHPYYASCQGARPRRQPPARPADSQQPLRASPAAAAPGRWTDEETQLLVRYVQTTRTARNWKYFAKYLGTKTKDQCTTKYRNLQRSGRLQDDGAA